MTGVFEKFCNMKKRYKFYMNFVRMYSLSYHVASPKTQIGSMRSLSFPKI